ncbi:MAG: manganese efflux pump MntP family protein [Bacillota bacterium]|nr:manganese efflux pump MntP family protein [Bacillota bacterium]
MMFGAGYFIKSVLLGVGLAMDAFSVSIANGLNEPVMDKRRMYLIAGTFGFFQAFMPLLGWFCVHNLVNYFKTFETFVPWIALILLLYIGGKMLIESIVKIRKGDADHPESAGRLTLAGLLVQGIATSIDALSVGFAIADYTLLMAVICALIIAVVTYIISMIGLHIGKRFGLKLADKAGILGGVILILIGIQIFIS